MLLTQKSISDFYCAVQCSRGCAPTTGAVLKILQHFKCQLSVFCCAKMPELTLKLCCAEKRFFHVMNIVKNRFSLMTYVIRFWEF